VYHWFILFTAEEYLVYEYTSLFNHSPTEKHQVVYSLGLCHKHNCTDFCVNMFSYFWVIWKLHFLKTLLSGCCYYFTFSLTKYE
jgi:hypothetical protein